MSKRILFLCTGNSARSQMAEAFLRKYAGDRFGGAVAFEGTDDEKLAKFREICDKIKQRRPGLAGRIGRSTIKVVTTVI